MLEIGSWVRRDGAYRSKWHLIESTIAGDAVTHCGRRLRNETAGSLEVSKVEPLTRAIGQPQLCKRCS